MLEIFKTNLSNQIRVIVSELFCVKKIIWGYFWVSSFYFNNIFSDFAALTLLFKSKGLSITLFNVKMSFITFWNLVKIFKSIQAPQFSMQIRNTFQVMLRSFGRMFVLAPGVRPGGARWYWSFSAWYRKMDLNLLCL